MGEHLKLKVWWCPQVPMNAFEVPVTSVAEGRLICDVLANYDIFQFENRVKPDYCNMGGIVYSHPAIEDGDWYDVPEDADEYAAWLEDIAAADAKISTEVV